jgi:transcription-repair coupling factor (superfamily II helicase)
MSVIDEPPQDRFPVQTYVMEYSDAVIAAAVARELTRGGQVYYIHNRVETIAECAAHIQELAPSARVAYAHGQMNEEDVSDIWGQVTDGDIDILVCTTIIETGVDVPNVNTLIVEHSDRLGLAQLYQLRGRVGRSNRRAYAYFTFKRDKILTEIASKRLEAIREFTQFGSGFKIAMRDLQIRGAGNVLSAKQHGHIESVGYDMYIKLLNEALAEEKGGAQRPSDCIIDIQVQAHIPEDYITDLSARFEAYRKITDVSSERQAADLTDELIDRYGDPPEEIRDLIRVALVRNKACGLYITEILQKEFVPPIPPPPVVRQSSLQPYSSGRYKKKPLTVRRPPKQEQLILLAETLSDAQIASLLKQFPGCIRFDPPPKSAVRIIFPKHVPPLAVLEKAIEALETHDGD